MRVKFPGFPSRIEQRLIEFPDPMDILREPILGFAPADWVRQNGSEFQRALLDLAPLRNNRRHVLMSTQVRVVTPGLLINPVEFPELGSKRNEWHVDYLSENAAVVHAVSNVLGTEFNEVPVEIELPQNAPISYRWFCREAALNEVQWGLRGRLAPDRQFVSFDRHIHRAPLATSRTLRYFIRIAEVDVMMNTTGCYRTSTSMLFNGSTPVRNLVQNDDGSIILHH